MDFLASPNHGDLTLGSPKPGSVTMPLTARDRLVLIRVKIERAKKHLPELESESAHVRGQNMHVVGPHYDPNTGKSSLGLAPLPILPFNFIATAGDIIQNLRTSLDHLAWHLAQIGLAQKGAANAEPHWDVSFPIAKTVEIYESMKRRKVQGMLPEAVKAIDSLKPYKGGNDPLWRLHELNNIDKHRTLVTIGHDCLYTGAGFDGGYWVKTSNPLFDGVIERIADPKVHEDLYFGRHKLPGELDVVKSQALLPTLHQLTEIVDYVVSSFLPLLE
jgi:hypothetical protein